MATITLHPSSTKIVQNEGSQTDPISTTSAIKCIACNAFKTGKQIALQWIVPSVTAGAIGAVGALVAGTKLNDVPNVVQKVTIGFFALQAITTVALRYFPKQG